MSRLKFAWSAAAFGLILSAPRLSSQPFVILVDQGPLGVSNVPNGGTINMVADAIGLANTARLTLSYRGSGSAAVPAIDRTGSNDFSVTLPTLPATLVPGQSLNLSLRFVPSSGARVGGRLTFSVTETAQDGAQSQSTIVVNLAGFAPDLVASYTLPNANAAPLPDGGTIPFPPTPLNTTTSAAVTIMNRGSAAGTV
ncbi:MAG: hypothetical protein AAB225_22410, partial [Acidobacteriota bacterium]